MIAIIQAPSPTNIRDVINVNKNILNDLAAMFSVFESICNCFGNLDLKSF